jgi:hypothetical protein
VLACAVAGVGFHWNTRVGGGSDSYGYVSQAEMWRSGDLTIAQPWVASLPWPNANWAAAPLGWRPRIVGEGDQPATSMTTMVPKYPPGLPWLMALGKSVAGQAGMFAVGPLAGAIVIAAIFGIGRRLGMPWAGVLAGWLVATSPVFLFMLVQPMSDVPVTAAWAVVFWCLLGATSASALFAGLAAAVAIVIRPNLVPIAGVIGIWLIARAAAERRGDWRQHAVRAALFAAGAAPGVIAIAALNWYWYASPLNSGYEPFDVLFRTEHFSGNVQRYFRWFIETQSPVAVFAFVALALPAVWRIGRPDGRWIVTLFAAVTATVWCIYFFYAQFDDWSFMRFVLPTWPLLMLALAAMIAQSPAARRPMVAAVLGVAVVALGLNGVRVARDRSAFELRAGEAKYVSIAKLVRQLTGRDAAVLSMQHSGTLRYYGGLLTFQWIQIPPHRLDSGVTWLNQHGVHPYALLEEWEVAEFRTRFSDQSALGKLAMAPIARFEGPTRIFLFDLLKDPSGNQDAGVTTMPYETDLRGWPGPVAPPRINFK